MSHDSKRSISVYKGYKWLEYYVTSKYRVQKKKKIFFVGKEEIFFLVLRTWLVYLQKREHDDNIIHSLIGQQMEILKI